MQDNIIVKRMKITACPSNNAKQSIAFMGTLTLQDWALIWKNVDVSAVQSKTGQRKWVHCGPGTKIKTLMKATDEPKLFIEYILPIPASIGQSCTCFREPSAE